MPATVSKYWHCMILGLKAGLEYRANFLLSVAGATTPVLIQTVLWVALYGADRQTALFGYNFAQMVGYTVVAQLVSRLVRTGFEYEMSNDIRTGSLDRYLSKPLSYFGYRLWLFIGDKLVQSLFMGLLLALAIGVLSVTVGFSLSLFALGCFVLALVVAFVFNFLFFWCIGLCGFWLQETGFLFEAVRIVIITASGGIFPLAVFGPGGEAVLRCLPFRFTIQVPTELVSGRLDPFSLGPDLLLAGLWIIALSLLARLLWQRGIRDFAALGS